ncbi:MAG: patatin family protein [Lachnospiraceae bacterium]|nr:patatin family protein [Lachnospiraceae bacterium]
MYNAGLILEGGGMRGAYTTGVLDYFLEHDIDFKEVYGVSAGACHATSYLSKQKGRSFEVLYKFVDDKRYMGIKNLISTGYLFGYDFTMKEIPERLVPFDYKAFDQNPTRFYSVAAEMNTGKAEALEVKTFKQDMDAIWASSSLPLISKLVRFKGKDYLDGGIANSIPLNLSRKHGNKMNVVILTRDPEYRKTPNKLMPLIAFKYRRYPAFVRAMARRHVMYNRTLEYIKNGVKAGKVFVIQPKTSVDVGRLEKDPKKLKKLYEQGYADAKESSERLNTFLDRCGNC